jgi:hypothetical protein
LGWGNGQTDMISPFCVHLMQQVQRDLESRGIQLRLNRRPPICQGNAESHTSKIWQRPWSHAAQKWQWVSQTQEPRISLTCSRRLLGILSCFYVFFVVWKILDVVFNAIVVIEQVLPPWKCAASSKTDTRQMPLSWKTTYWLNTPYWTLARLYLPLILEVSDFLTNSITQHFMTNWHLLI